MASTRKERPSRCAPSRDFGQIQSRAAPSSFPASRNQGIQVESHRRASKSRFCSRERNALKLSITIPSYNRAHMVRGTIDSILNNGLDDLEVIVVDDGSTDDTEDVIRPLGPPIHYFRQTNQGLAAARNSGFRLSRGKYVAFLDSDDQWLPGAVPTILNYLDANEDVPFILGDTAMGSPEDGFASFIATFGGEPFRELPSRELSPGLRRYDRRPLFHQLVRRNFAFMGSMVFRREVIEQTGPFDTRLQAAEDWHYFMRLALHYNYCCCEGLTVSTYLKHSSNMTRDLDRMNKGFCMARGDLAQGIQS